MDPNLPRRKFASWLNELNASPLFIEPGSPRENGYVESFNSKMRMNFASRSLLHVGRSEGVDRGVAEGIKSGATPQCVELSTTGTGSPSGEDDSGATLREDGDYTNLGSGSSFWGLVNWSSMNISILSFLL